MAVSGNLPGLVPLRSDKSGTRLAVRITMHSRELIHFALFFVKIARDLHCNPDNLNSSACISHRVFALGSVSNAGGGVKSYPVLKTSFNLDFGQIGLITLTFQLTSSLLQPLVGFYTDQKPKPFSLAIGMGVSLCGLLLLSQVWSFAVILLAADHEYGC